MNHLIIPSACFLRALHSALAGRVGGSTECTIRAESGVCSETHEADVECCRSLSSSPSPHPFLSGADLKGASLGPCCREPIHLQHLQSRPAGCQAVCGWWGCLGPRTALLGCFREGGRWAAIGCFEGGWNLF